MSQTEITQAGQDFISAINLSPKYIVSVSFIGLIITLLFILSYRKKLINSYGTNIYFWFLFIIALNILNIFFISAYYQYKYNTFFGKRGIEGTPGHIGLRGDNRKCGYCNADQEIGLQYSNKYYPIITLEKTTNLIGLVSFWKPVSSLGLAPMGDVIFPRKQASKSKTYMGGFGTEPATDFKRIININDGTQTISIWEAIPKEGYTALGHFVSGTIEKPNPKLISTLPTKCLVKNKGYPFNYVASFPAIDVIPTYTQTVLKFCSFWTTPLNHMYCKISDTGYITQSLYYNIVEGHPEYYDNKKRRPISSKIKELENLLKNKMSIIQHHKKVKGYTASTAKFVQNIRDPFGKVIKYKIHAKAFTDYLEESKTVENYIKNLHQAFKIIYNLKKDSNKGYPVEIIHQDGSSNTSLFKSILTKINQSLKDLRIYKMLDQFFALFTDNAQIVIDSFKDAKIGIKEIAYGYMSFFDKLKAVDLIFIKLSIKELEKALYRFKAIGIEKKTQSTNFFGDQELLEAFQNYRDIIGNKSIEPFVDGDSEDKKRDNISFLNFTNLEKEKALKDQKAEVDDQIDTNLSLWDDLLYLFENGFDHQIVANEKQIIEDGYYLDSIENRQRKNFVEYLRTFIKPNHQTYSFRKKCMIFEDNDKERNLVIQELNKAFNFVGRQLAGISKFKNCDRPEKVKDIYDQMVRRIDRYFRTIDNYQEKLKEQDFSDFPTGRLKWLLNEMNTYHKTIQTYCKSDNRQKLNAQIKVYRTRLEKDYYIDLDIDLEKNKHSKLKDIDNLKEKIITLDTDNLTMEQLFLIYKIYKKEYLKRKKEFSNGKNDNKNKQPK